MAKAGHAFRWASRGDEEAIGSALTSLSAQDDNFVFFLPLHRGTRGQRDHSSSPDRSKDMGRNLLGTAACPYCQQDSSCVLLLEGSFSRRTASETSFGQLSIQFVRSGNRFFRFVGLLCM